METAGALVDEFVSRVVWVRFPELLTSIRRWTEQAKGTENLEVSAVPIGIEWVSVRVTLTEGEGLPVHWLEWLIPTSFKSARQSALDHFAAREMQTAARQLKARSDWAGHSKHLPEPFGGLDPSKADEESRGEPMARAKATEKPTEPPAASKSKPAKPTKAAPAKAKAKAASRPASQPEGAPVAAPPKAKATRAKPAKAAAPPRAETRSKVDTPKPPAPSKAKSPKKPATAKPRSR